MTKNLNKKYQSEFSIIHTEHDRSGSKSAKVALLVKY